MLTISEVNAVQSNYFDKTLTQIVYEECILYYKLKQKNNIVVDGGNEIQWPIRYQEYGKAKFSDPDEQRTYKGKNTRTAATAEWRYLTNDALITLKERTKNSGKAQIVNLLKDKNEELREDAMEEFANRLYDTTQSDLAFNSLDTIIDSSGSFGGIDPSDAALWASTEDSSTTQLVLYGPNSLSYMINQATFGKKMPNLHITTRDLFSKFESLLEPNKRYYDESTADGGFQNLTFKGVPVVGDSHCTSARWYGICLDDMEIRYHKDFNMKTSEWFDLKQAGYPEHLAKVLTWAGNIICRNRRTNFKFTALDYTK